MRNLLLLFITFLISAEEIDTLFGKTEFNEPILIELLNSQAVKRIQEIDQHGISYYYHLTPSFTRYDHSVGVFQLLRRYGAPLREQVAGLLHDVSHTTFSHVGDHIFDHQDGTESYQDTIHHWFIGKIGLEPLLKKYNLTAADILNKNLEFQMLEQDLPDICVDRLEYNLHTAHVYNLLSTEEIEKILSDITFENGKWIFLSPSIARKFASISLHFTENLWGADWNLALCHWTAGAIKRGLEINLITHDEIHLSTDRPLLEKLNASSDSAIQSFLHKCKHYKQEFSHASEKDFTFFTCPKFRGIDPLVKQGDTLKRLTDIDPDYAKEYIRVREKLSRGYYLNL
jgi:uncharacterized protein